jgi:hypothetical protein
MAMKFRSRLSLDRLDERALPSVTLPPPDTTASAVSPGDDNLGKQSGALNFQSVGSVDSGVIHIETKDGDKYDLPFTVAGGETPAQFAERIANVLRSEGFLTDVNGGEITVRERNGDPITGIGAGVTGTNNTPGKLKPGTSGDVERLQPVRDGAGRITGWEKYQSSIADDGTVE